MLIARYGQFYKGDGEDVLIQGNVGLPFTDAGFVNISGEYVNANTTSRGVQRPDAQALIDAGVEGVPVPAQRWGNPESEAARIFVNAGIDLSDEMEFYTFGNYSWSRGTTAFFYRHPDTSFISTSIPLTSTPGATLQLSPALSGRFYAGIRGHGHRCRARCRPQGRILVGPDL